jgi:hypothetical protein
MIKESQYRSLAPRLGQLKNDDVINEREKYDTKQKEIWQTLVAHNLRQKFRQSYPARIIQLSANPPCVIIP